MNIKVLFQRFLDWKLMEDELRQILLALTHESETSTYVLGMTTNRTWWISDNKGIMGIGVRVAGNGQSIRSTEVMTVRQFNDMLIGSSVFALDGSRRMLR